MGKNEKLILLSVPNLSGREWEYVKDCLDTGWISTAGSYVNKFEEAVARFVGAKYGVATMNGTAGLHIALQLMGVQSNDYVVVSNLTFVASANAIKYTGAEPILIDADPHTWQMDLDLLEEFLDNETYLNDSGDRLLKKDNRCIRVIMPVHVQGNIFNVERFSKLCKKYNMPFIEDAAEALGSTYEGISAGRFGEMGILSFNGNKIISCGGGGVIITDNEDLAKQAKHITTTAKTDPLRYYHDEVGYNYRLVNILAAIGVAQMEQLPEFIKKKKFIGDYYRHHLEGIGDIKFQKVLDKVDHNDWLFTIQTSYQSHLLKYLNNNKILSRPFWMPMNQLPMYASCHYITQNDNSKYIHDTCMAIPCSTNITESELSIVVEEIKKGIEHV